MTTQRRVLALLASLVMLTTQGVGAQHHGRSLLKSGGKVHRDLYHRDEEYGTEDEDSGDSSPKGADDGDEWEDDEAPVRKHDALRKRGHSLLKSKVHHDLYHRDEEYGTEDEDASSKDAGDDDEWEDDEAPARKRAAPRKRGHALLKSKGRVHHRDLYHRDEAYDGEEEDHAGGEWEDVERSRHRRGQAAGKVHRSHPKVGRKAHRDMYHRDDEDIDAEDVDGEMEQEEMHSTGQKKDSLSKAEIDGMTQEAVTMLLQKP